MTVLAAPEDAEDARGALGADIDVVPAPLDDAWLRDSGPTFVHAPDGRRLRVVDVPAPTVLDDGSGPVDWSCINHHVVNGAVILCAFDDPNDDLAAAILAEAHPDRTVELVDARDVFAFGGGIHCITQQQPSVR